MDMRASPRVKPPEFVQRQMPRVEKSVPMPPRPHPGPPPYKYPWRQMKVGDSFVFPARATHRKTVNAASGATAHRQRAQGETYSIRSVVEDGVLVVRVWRMA